MSRTLTGIILILVVCGTLAVTPAGADLWPFDRNDVIGYILSAQQPNGQFAGSYPAYMVAALRALGGQPGDPAALAGFWHAHEHADGSFDSGDGVGDLWPTYDAVASLLSANGQPANLPNTVNFIASRWRSGDGIFRDNNGLGDQWGNGRMFQALWSLTGTTNWTPIVDAVSLNYLASTQKPDGSWFEQVLHTYFGTLTYWILPGVSPAQVHATAHPATAKRPALPAGQPKNLRSLLTSSVRVRPAYSPPSNITAVLTFMASSQHPDGSFGNYPGDPNKSYAAALWAVAALKYYNSPLYDESALRGWLASNYQGGGRWADMDGDPNDGPTESAFAALTAMLLDDNFQAVQIMQSGDFSLGPDMMAKNRADSAYIGDNIYESNDEWQVKSQTVGAGQAAIYDVVVENKGLQPDDINIVGFTGNESFSVTYFDSGGADVTAAVTGGGEGGWEHLGMNHGDKVQFSVVVVPDAATAVGDTWDVIIGVASEKYGFKSDGVSLKTTRAPLAQNTNLIAAGESDRLVVVDPVTPNAQVLTTDAAWWLQGWWPEDMNVLGVDLNNYFKRIPPSGPGTELFPSGQDPPLGGDISPDGMRIAYYGGGPTGIQYGIWLAGVDGSNPSLLALGGQRPRWSPDGLKIAYALPGTPDAIWVVGVDGSDPHQVTSGVNGGWNCDDPEWSADSNTLYFTAGTASVFVGPGSVRKAAVKARARAARGKSVAPRETPTEQSDIYQIAASARSSSAATLVTAAGGFNRYPAASPDGSQIAFVHGAAGSYDAYELWVARANGSNPHQVYTTPFGHRGGNSTNEMGYIAWSRVGRVYGTHQPDLVVIPLDGTSPRGDGTYNSDGTGQQDALIIAAPGGSATYQALLQNDGSVPDTFTVTGPGSGGGWSVQYYHDSVSPANEITGAVTGKGWATPTIAPAGSIKLLVVVHADTSLADGATRDVLLTASVSAVAGKVDAALFHTKKQNTQPDLLIRNQGEANYAGEGIYNPANNSQTRSQLVPAGTTAVYELQLQNDGPGVDMYRLTGTAGGGGWTIKYFLTTHSNDVTTALIGGNLTVQIPVGGATGLWIEVTPDGTVAGGTRTEADLTAASSDGRFTDVARTITTAASHQPDLLIRNAADSNYLGDGTYSADGSGETKSQSALAGAAAVYFVQLQNDGNVQETCLLRGPGDTTGWTVRYFYMNPATGDVPITADVTGSGGYTTNDVAPGGVQDYRIEVTPDRSVGGGASRDVLLTAAARGDATKVDAVKATTTNTPTYQPDMLIRNTGDSSYIGSGIYNADGTNQTKSQLLAGSTPGVYELTVQNQGNMTQDIAVTANVGGLVTAVAPSWSVRFYDALTAGNDITTAVTGTGWVIRGVQPHAAVAFRAEVRFISNVPGNASQATLVTATSQVDASADTAKASSSNTPHNQPDLEVRNPADSTYQGAGTYNSTGAGQSTAQSVGSGAPAVYYLNLVNAGNLQDTYTVTGTGNPPAPGDGFTLTYYDAPTGGNDITSSVTGGWKLPPLNPGDSRQFRVEVAADSGVKKDASKLVIVIAQSGADSAKLDCVQMTTTKAGSFQPDLLIRNASESAYTGGGTINATGTGQTKTQMAGATTAAVYQLEVQNTGDTDDQIKLTGSLAGVAAAAVSLSGWTMTVYDSPSGSNDITGAVTGGGWRTAILKPGAAFDFRVELKSEGGASAGAAAAQALIQATSSTDATKLDVVKALANREKPQPDGMIRASSEAAYLGGGTYNTTGDGQTDTQNVSLTGTAIYLVKVQNTGNAPDTFTVSSQAMSPTSTNSGGWTVAFYDAVSGGSDITSQVLAGWSTGALDVGATREFRVEVTATGAAALIAPRTVPVSFVSTADPTATDTVKAVTTLLPAQPFSRDFISGIWLVGVPCRPLIPSADQVFGTTSLASWNAQTQDYQYFATQPFSVAPGMGVWVKYTDAHTVSFDGYPVAGAVTVDVYRGWNLLGNSWASAMPWTSVSANGSVEPYGWALNATGTDYRLVWALSGPDWDTQVGPWQGFWLYANERCQVTLSAAAPAAAPAAKRAQDAISWSVRLAARTEGAAIKDNFIGVAKASAGLTVANPPALQSGGVDLWVTDAKGAHNAVSMCGAKEKTAWDVVALAGQAKTRVEISYPDLSAVPSNLALVLTDLETGKSVNMRTTRSYSFTSGAANTPRKLHIEAKPRGAQAAILTSLTAQSAPAGLQVVYALSAPADVELQVLNIAGRPVAQIPCGYQAAGSHTASWSGRSAAGSKAPAGKYLVTVRCSADDGTQITRIIPAQVR